MTTFKRCDGCGTELGVPSARAGRKEWVIHGGRADGMSGGHPLPDGEFDWCRHCAMTAFAAVAAAKKQEEGT